MAYHAVPDAPRCSGLGGATIMEVQPDRSEPSDSMMRCFKSTAAACMHACTGLINSVHPHVVDVNAPVASRWPVRRPISPLPGSHSCHRRVHTSAAKPPHASGLAGRSRGRSQSWLRRHLFSMVFVPLLSISIATGLVLTSKDTKHVSGREETGEQVAMLSSSLAFPVVDMSMRACMQASSSASKLLKETCSYIMSLPREVDDLSGRLSYLTLTLGPDSPQAEITRSILGS
ncbi:hypothetical protein B296_00033922 [Ensete ventricosum]|uniref:Uncharacterized protein n=1 Tax=Ensete ventricosum TaxID=4639 RepID=A0A427A0U8_ENSVE|nr:hypothetical protein B296_00033922 [Ensete ventricosum]